MSNHKSTWTEEITAETGLMDLFILIFKIPYKPINIIIPLLISIFLFLISYHEDSISIRDVIAFIEESTGWVYSILSFLVAGYTIFATVTSLDLSVALMKVKNPESGLPYLKHIHVVFYKVIFSFSIVGLIGILFIAFSKPNNLYTINLIKLIKSNSTWLYPLIYSSYVFLLTTSLMLLLSFLFNIYATVMLAVRWKAESEE
jgi:hypothetical protein